MVNENDQKPSTSSSSNRGRKRRTETANTTGESQEPKRLRRTKEFLQLIDTAVIDILSRAHNNPPSCKDYMRLYSDVYQNLVEGSVRVRRRSNNSGETSTQGCNAEEIYNRLESILKKKMRSLIQETKPLKDRELLRHYVSSFALYRRHVTFLDGIFSYMNRAWVKSVNTGASDDRETIFSFSMKQWRTSMFREFNEKVSSSLLSLLQEMRPDLKDDDDIITTAVASYLIMSDPKIASKTKRPTDPNLEIYITSFETKLLEQSRTLYNDVATKWAKDKPMEAYLLDVEQYLAKEEGSARQLFHSTTVKKLVDAMLDEFIRNKISLLLEAMPRLMTSNDLDSLKCMFRHLFRLHDFSLESTVASFKAHVVTVGRNALTAFHNSVQSKEIEGKLISVRYVENIVEVCRKYENIITLCMNNHVGFRTALDEAAVVFVNQNAHARTGPEQYNLNKTPELLARYSNVLLSNDVAINHDSFPEALEKLFLVLKYAESKDSFEKYYNWNLVNRLIHKSSVNEDNEVLVITKMKTMFGQDYSLKSFQLTQDARISKDITAKFKTALQAEGSPVEFDFHITVFKNGSCKLPECPPFNLARPLVTAVQSFNTYYGKQYEGRRLSWFHNKSHGELIYNTGPNMTRKYTFAVSAYQMTILILFNEKTSWTFDEIQETTLIDTKILCKVMTVLERTKLLVKRDSSSYAIYEGYKSNKFKHDINIPIKMDVRSGSGAPEDFISEDVQNQRRFVLQAVVVRLMKAKQSMRHSDLIAETIEAVKDRFKPNITQIKRTIDSLIEKEYLKRDENEAERYIYIS